MGRFKAHPTCGLLPLRQASKIVAFLDMTLGLIGIVWFVYMLGRYDIVSLDPFEADVDGNTKVTKLNNLMELDIDIGSGGQSEKKLSKNHKIIGLTLAAFFTSINLSLFVVLLIGIHRKHMGLCLTWFYIRCAVIVFKLIIFIMYLIAGRPLFSQIPFIIFMAIHAYGVWIVNTYVEELRAIRYRRDLDNLSSQQGGGRPRSDSEVSERPNGIEKIQQRRKEHFTFENEAHKQSDDL